MNVVREWAQSVVIAALIAAIVSAAAPSGSLEKPMKTIIALFMLLAFVTPLVKISAEIPQFKDGFDEIIEQRELEKKVESEVMTVLESEIKTSVVAYISSLGCSSCKVETEMDIDSDKNISIRSIKIYLPQQFAQTAAVEKYVADKFGVKPEIILGSGEENETEN